MKQKKNETKKKEKRYYPCHVMSRGGDERWGSRGGKTSSVYVGHKHLFYIHRAWPQCRTVNSSLFFMLSILVIDSRIFKTIFFNRLHRDLWEYDLNIAQITCCGTCSIVQRGWRHRSGHTDQDPKDRHYCSKLHFYCYSIDLKRFLKMRNFLSQSIRLNHYFFTLLPFQDRITIFKKN